MNTASCFVLAFAAAGLILAGSAHAGARAAAPAAPAPPAPLGPGERSFALVNTDKTGITSVYAAKTGSEDWTDDLLGKQTAGPGKSVTLRFKGAESQCAYDLQVLMNDGKPVQKSNIDLCQTQTYQFAR